jgi:Family of unknown function (DUF6134)
MAKSALSKALARPRVDWPRNKSLVEFLMRPWLVWMLPVLGILTVAIPARAQERAYSYSVVHPFYGTIGTFTESIVRSGDTTRIDSHVRVAVRIVGIVVHREQGDHIEIFHGDRLVSLQSATTTNGTRIDVRGEAQGDRFVVTSAAGVVEAPADVAPSDPWVLKQVGVGTVVSVKTGRIILTRVTGGEPAKVALQGVTITTRHFMARGEREQEIWLNDQDVPIMFRSVESGAPIDFVLTSPWRDAAVAEAHLVPSAKLKPEGAN